MASYTIDIRETVRVPRDRVFALFADHRRFGEMLGAKARRVKDSAGDDPNGIGSVRRIDIAGPLGLEETITGFEPDSLIEYTITSRSPIRNHFGRIHFADAGDGSTEVHYRINFDDIVPFTGKPIHSALEQGIRKGIRRIPKIVDAV